MKRIEDALPRIALAAAAVLALSGLFWWKADDRAPTTGGNALITVQATSPPATDAPIDALAVAQQHILEAIGEPGMRLRNLRIVDQERLIVCGERIGGGSATSRRFVWLSQLRQLVTDDGGPDFAILLHVCNPPPGAAKSRGLD